MRLRELQSASEATLKALAENRAAVKFEKQPYFGFYEADIFNCPPPAHKPDED